MKKVSLVSMLAVLAFSTAASANVENPFYAPAKGKLYSKTSLSKADSTLALAQKFGYGITNRLVIDGSINYVDQDKEDGEDGFGAYSIGGAYRLSANRYITDVYGNYSKYIDKDVVGERTEWEAGLKTGIRTTKSALAFSAGINYIEFMPSMDTNNIVLGVEGAYSFDDRISANLGFRYTIADDYNQYATPEEDAMTMTAQINYQKAGLWSLAYTTELKDDRDIDNIWTLKYGYAF